MFQGALGLDLSAERGPGLSWVAPLPSVLLLAGLRTRVRKAVNQLAYMLVRGVDSYYLGHRWVLDMDIMGGLLGLAMGRLPSDCHVASFAMRPFFFFFFQEATIHTK